MSNVEIVTTTPNHRGTVRTFAFRSEKTAVLFSAQWGNEQQFVCNRNVVVFDCGWLWKGYNFLTNTWCKDKYDVQSSVTLDALDQPVNLSIRRLHPQIMLQYNFRRNFFGSSCSGRFNRRLPLQSPSHNHQLPKVWKRQASDPLITRLSTHNLEFRAPSSTLPVRYKTHFFLNHVVY